MDHCSNCGTVFESPVVEKCPSCGKNFLPDRPTPWFSPITGYFRSLWNVIIRPTYFFRNTPYRTGFSKPLAFALVTHWIGAAISFLWRNMLGGHFDGFFSKLFQAGSSFIEVDDPGKLDSVAQVKDQIIHWFWGTGAVIADPFLTLFSILFTSFFVFLGARILVNAKNPHGPGEVTFESAVRIVSYGMGPSIFSAFPVVGTVFATLWTAVVTIIGAKETYRIGLGRSFVVGLFPKLLFLGTIFLSLAFFLLLLIKFVTSIF